MKFLAIFHLFVSCNAFKLKSTPSLQNILNKSMICSSTAEDVSRTLSLESNEAIKHLIARFEALSPREQRAVSSVVGAAVADAATRPFHWVYDRTVLESTIADKNPAFWPESISPFYSLPTGRRSCYNDIGYCQLLSLSSDSLFDRLAYIKALTDFFSPHSEYAIALNKRKEAYDPLRKLEKREPIPGPWQQGAVTKFLDHVEKQEEISGSPDSMETDGLTSTIPLIARLSLDESVNEEQFESTVREAASILSSNATALKFTLTAARLIRLVIATGQPVTLETIQQVFPDDEDYAEVKDALKDVASAIAQGENLTDSQEKYGKGCSNPGQPSSHLMSSSDSYLMHRLIQRSNTCCVDS